MKFRRVLTAVLFVALAACGGTGDDTTNPPATDTDGDGISDADEGAATNIDTDGDGTPDYQDADSDGDGIEDYREGGDADPATAPVDSDGDGTPDFRDTDSDNNGRPDGVDGAGDLDGDGQADFQDPDDDGDGIPDGVELGSDPLNPVNTDGTDAPDFQDTDSDNDTILDRDDGVIDYDGDTIGNWRDTDSDGDCRSDQVESGGVSPPRDTDGDSRPDFNDLDSDDDGLLDSAEDLNCNGVRDGTETDAGNADTDGDGVSDLIEAAAGTDANDPLDNPQANGDFVFIEPYQAPQFPTDDDLDFSSRLQALDMYVIIDRSGSMSTEIAAVRNNLATAVRNLTCPPLGTGDPATCIPDLWAGAGTVGYSGSGANTYSNHVDLQPLPSFAAIPTTEPAGCCAEPLNFSVFAAITGNGTAAATGCGLSGVNPRATCAGSPAANAGYPTFGYPCFREGALPVILLATDEQPLSAGDTNKCPNWNTVVLPQMTSRSARLVGILGSGFAANTDVDLRAMATATGAVDAAAGNAPLVFDGAGANAATAIENGIRTLANGVPLDLAAGTSDDPSDAVDAVAAFVDHLETLQLGTAACANMLTDRDSNGDGFRDAYDNVRAGTPVCWKLFSKVNNAVPATDQPQLFKATVTVTGDGVTVLDTRDVYFLVPPEPQDPPIN
ncbi:MAG: VWA domain-containing protein [Myxococcales bacterium]|nr:VWA domain-containing protein [Myxococcales bacterium]